MLILYPSPMFNWRHLWMPLNVSVLIFCSFCQFTYAYCLILLKVFFWFNFYSFIFRSKFPAICKTFLFFVVFSKNPIKKFKNRVTSIYFWIILHFYCSIVQFLQKIQIQFIICVKVKCVNHSRFTPPSHLCLVCMCRSSHLKYHLQSNCFSPTFQMF